MGYYFFDSYYLLLVVPALIIAMIAQARVSSTFKKYSSLASVKGITAAQAARQILDSNGLRDIPVEHVSGSLTDHYDPRKKVIRLSDTVFHSTSVASIGVAAHEAGHAVQHATAYAPLMIRNFVYPVVSISSQAAVPLILLGFVFSFPALINIGILLFSAVVAFQLITLPVEFNASARALTTLDEHGVLTKEELSPAKKVLGAAAMTYVASALVSIATLLRFILIARDRR